LQTVCLDTHAHAVGRRLRELGLDETGAQVVAIRRSGIRGDEPLGDALLQSEDAVVIEGTNEQLDRARQRLLQG
jgi:CPA2 family monovalent cation:H+ antiporter-2